MKCKKLGKCAPMSYVLNLICFGCWTVAWCLPMRSLIHRSRHMARWLWHDMRCLWVFVMVLWSEWLSNHEVCVALPFWHVLLMRGKFFAKLPKSILASSDGCETWWSCSWDRYEAIEYLTCSFGHV
jgi:hypothetical protein